MTKVCVIGHPVTHSKSPRIHNYWIKKYGLDGNYDAVDIPCENLREGVAELVAKGYRGFNVTIPHKEAVLSLCDELDEGAQQIGAVNTVVIDGGKLRGRNTDAFGFIQNIRQEAPKFSFAAGSAVVLGAGGAAKAVVHGLLEHGTPEVFVLNRTKEKALILAKSSLAPDKVVIANWDERSKVLEGASLLVNTTALGMEGKDTLDIDLALLPRDALVTDIVYTPLYTPLLVDAKKRGHKTVTGIGMLLHQARPAFQAWFGVMPEVTPELEKMVTA
ncbi:MAG TPA: shikimate dehydrogenase [Rhodospirillaceae bacterium]|nr:shikimate dehydrogenase [Rhodospirillaceae bacterium]